jgi:hypothetical protein
MTNTPLQITENAPSHLIAAQNELSRPANLSRKLEMPEMGAALTPPWRRKISEVLVRRGHRLAGGQQGTKVGVAITWANLPKGLSTRRSCHVLANSSLCVFVL